MCHHLRTYLPCKPASVPAARHWLIPQLRRIYGHLDVAVEDASIVLTELATNCVDAGAHFFAVAVEAHHDRITLATTDDAAGMPTPRTPGPFDTGGRCLRIVAALADNWGVDTGPRTKTVWAELPVPADAAPRFECYGRMPSAG